MPLDFKGFKGTRFVSSRVNQAITGYAFLELYYRIERDDSPCGHNLQTREHVLGHCHLMNEGRRAIGDCPSSAIREIQFARGSRLLHSRIPYLL